MNEKKKRHSTIWLRFALVVFLTTLAAISLVMVIFLVLDKLGYLPEEKLHRTIPFLMLILGSLLIGGSIALYVGKFIITPIQNIGKGFDELSKGNFDVRVNEEERISEIRDISRQFNHMTYDLSHMETLKSDFVTNVSHEFKTPLSSIEGYATLLQNPNLSQEKRDRYIEKILENSNRLSTLTSNILLLSKLENQQMVVDLHEYRLDEQIRRAILLLEDKWSKKEIVFDLELEDVLYYGSENLLEHVFFNLIDNAVKFSKENSMIHVSLKEKETSISVLIQDHGEGMSEEQMKHIFDKFYQGDVSRKKEGNGLGLSLVKRILQILNADIHVESRIGEGTSFSLSLPIVKE